MLMAPDIRHDIDYERGLLAAVEDAHDRAFNRHLLYRDSDGKQELLQDAWVAADSLISGPWPDNTEDLIGYC